MLAASGGSRMTSGLCLQVSSSHFCDAKPLVKRNPMRYVNSVAARCTCNSQNVAMARSKDSDTSPISYVATRDIEIGEELLTSYGPT